MQTDNENALTGGVDSRPFRGIRNGLIAAIVIDVAALVIYNLLFRWGTVSKKVYYSTNQILNGLEALAGVRISRERLRQLREGGVEVKVRRNGTKYRRAYDGQLDRGAHWEWIDGDVGYTIDGARAIFAKYGVQLDAGTKGTLASFPWRAPRTATGMHA